MANSTKVPNDIIPAKAGLVRVIPVKTDGTLDRANAYTTKRNFLTSTQVTITRTSETLPNGNGSDKDYPTDEKYNLAVVTQTYDPKFHSMISNKEKVTTPRPRLYDTSITVPATTAYEVDLTDNEPVAVDGEAKPVLEIRDQYGNLLTVTDSTVSEGSYKYDPDTKTLTFDASAAGLTFSAVYYVASTGADGYQASPILRSPQFQIEIMAETQSADTGEIVYYNAVMTRAVVSGDIPNVTSQKSINNAITYNFTTAPVAQGVSAFTETFTPESQV